MSNTKQHGFTLIEVLIALAIIAIAMTAILVANGNSIRTRSQLTDRLQQHMVAGQVINGISLGIHQLQRNRPLEDSSVVMGTRWYWRVQLGKVVQPGLFTLHFDIGRAANARRYRITSLIGQQRLVRQS